jgi:hypothetical protein
VVTAGKKVMREPAGFDLDLTYFLDQFFHITRRRPGEGGFSPDYCAFFSSVQTFQVFETWKVYLRENVQ